MLNTQPLYYAFTFLLGLLFSPLLIYPLFVHSSCQSQFLSKKCLLRTYSEDAKWKSQPLWNLESQIRRQTHGLVSMTDLTIFTILKFRMSGVSFVLWPSISNVKSIKKGHMNFCIPNLYGVYMLNWHCWIYT